MKKNMTGLIITITQKVYLGLVFAFFTHKNINTNK